MDAPSAPASPRSSWSTVGTLAGMVVGAVLLFAAYAKIIDPERFQELLADKDLLFGMPARWVALAAIALETLVGLALLLGIRRIPVLLLATAMVGFFTWQATEAWLAWLEDPEAAAEGCGCFGGIVERSPQVAFFMEVGLAVLVVLAWLGRPRGPWPRARTMLTLVGTTAGVVVAFLAPDLPLDDLATRLHQGDRADEVCYGKPGTEEQTCLSRLLVDWAEGEYLVVLVDRHDDEGTEALNGYAEWMLDEGGTGPALIGLHSLTKDERAAWEDADVFPGFDLRDAPPGLLRSLYRRLPRSFLVRNGSIVEIWNGLPPLTRWMKSP